MIGHLSSIHSIYVFIVESVTFIIMTSICIYIIYGIQSQVALYNLNAEIKVIESD